MWVEAKNENLGLINVAHYYNIRPVYNRVVATSVANEEDVYLFHGEPEEAQAAYARIRDALARGEKFVSLRKTAGDEHTESTSGEADDPSTYCGRLIRDGRVVVPDWPTAHTVIRQAFNACYVAAVSGGSLQGPFTIRLYERV